MPSYADRQRNVLFCSYDLSEGLAQTKAKAVAEVGSIPENRFLNTAPEDLKSYLVEKHSVEPVTLLRDQASVDVRETQVDVRYDQMRFILDQSRPALVPGESIDIHVPFSGEKDLLYGRPSRFTLNAPHARIEGSEVILHFESPSDSPQDVRPLMDGILNDIEQYLGWQRPAIEGHNQSLPALVGEAIASRRERLLAQKKRAEALGIPVRQREGAPNTYAIPVMKRKAAPVMPPAVSSEYSPEPTWAMEHYEHALTVMQNMTLVMERSPGAFVTMDEEAIRQHFLVQLNGQFEGNSTGETFNMAGKTDILLREGGRNVFIAECKFWKGPKAFAAAVDQLLGYATWRDSKNVILVFNRTTDPTKVLASIDATVKAHDAFKRTVVWAHESGFRYVLGNPQDRNREMILSVLMFHVPSQDA